MFNKTDCSYNNLCFGVTVLGCIGCQ